MSELVKTDFPPDSETIADERKARTAEVDRLAALIDVQVPMTIVSFGEEVSEKTTEYADDLLSRARSKDMEAVGFQLNQIVETAQSFNLNQFDHAWARTPVVGGILKAVFLSKEKLLARYDSVKGQIDRLIESVEVTSETLTDRGSEFDAMYAGVQAEHALLGLHVEALQSKVSELEATIANTSDDGVNADQQESQSRLQDSREAMLKRADDLNMLQLTALQTLPMIRVMQTNNLALIDKFNTVQKLTLPAWKRTLLMALTLDEQKNAADLAGKIDDATNDFMKRNADMLQQNSVAIAQSNQRLIVDMDTLKHVHEKMLETLDDVRTIHRDGAERRERIVIELEKMNREMVSGTREVTELITQDA